MDQLTNQSKKPPHLRIAAPSAWVRRFAPTVAEGGTVLDVTCGGGRHSRLFLEMGRKVVAVDRNLEYVSDLHDHPGAELIGSDLEDGSSWPLNGRAFAGVVVILNESGS